MFLAQRNEAGAEIIVFDVLNLENFADRPAHARGAADRKGHVQAAVGLFEELANRLGYLPVDDQEPGCRRAVAVGLCHIERSPIMVALQEPRRDETTVLADFPRLTDTGRLQDERVTDKSVRGRTFFV